MASPVLGILTLYLNDKRQLEERRVYEHMTRAGEALGLKIIVFTPQDVDDSSRRIHALVYNTATGVWSRKWLGFPSLIYDRCRLQRSHRFRQLQQFRIRYKHLHFLNRPMRNKWTVYRTLMQEARFRKHLPLTRLVESSQDWKEMLQRFRLLYLKPINGTGGRGILRIEHKEGRSWLIQGRDHARRIIKPQIVPERALLQRLNRWDWRDTPYLIQQGIQLKLPSGRVHDYRMLVQKNGQGEWEVTGCAGRIGPLGSVTSNLHGGGKAARMHTLLRSWIGDNAKAEATEQEAAALGKQLCEYLEAQYDHLCELALDLAIDREGHIWLLEVNPKPAREVFARAGEKETYRNAIVRPLEYALWLHKQLNKQ